MQNFQFLVNFVFLIKQYFKLAKLLCFKRKILFNKILYRKQPKYKNEFMNSVVSLKIKFFFIITLRKNLNISKMIGIF